MFRIRQTGVNSNNHHYLACSGFEVYGFAQNKSEVGVIASSSSSALGAVERLPAVQFQDGMAFKYQSDLDTNGE